MELITQLDQVLDAYAKLAYAAIKEEEWNEGACCGEYADTATARLGGFRLALTLLLPSEQLNSLTFNATAIAQQLHEHDIACMLVESNALDQLLLEEEAAWSEWYALQNTCDEYAHLPNNGWPEEFNYFDSWAQCMQAIEEQWLYWAEMPGCLTAAAG